MRKKNIKIKYIISALEEIIESYRRMQRLTQCPICELFEKKIEDDEDLTKCNLCFLKSCQDQLDFYMIYINASTFIEFEGKTVRIIPESQRKYVLSRIKRHEQTIEYLKSLNRKQITFPIMNGSILNNFFVKNYILDNYS